MKIRKSKYHQKSVKVVHCGALIWRKFSTNCDAHLAERFFKGRENNHLLKSLFTLSVIFMAFTASGCTLAVPEAGTDGNGDRLIGAFITSEYLDLYDMEGYLNDHAASLMNLSLIHILALTAYDTGYLSYRSIMALKYNFFFLPGTLNSVTSVAHF